MVVVVVVVVVEVVTNICTCRYGWVCVSMQCNLPALFEQFKSVRNSRKRSRKRSEDCKLQMRQLRQANWATLLANLAAILAD